MNSHSGTSLPPTISESWGTGAAAKTKSTHEPTGSSISYSPSPVVLTPRHRNFFVSREVFTTLSPPQSPDVVVRRQEMPLKMIKGEEKNPPAKSTMNAFEFEESILIDVLEISSKLGIPRTIHSVVEEHQVSPPVPFQKTHKRDSPLTTNRTVAEEEEKVKMIDPAKPIPPMADKGEADIEALFKSTLIVVFACYLVGIAFFFFMCKQAFAQQAVVGEMDFLPAHSPTVSGDMERKDRFHFVKQNVALLGEFSMRLERDSLLPLNGMKQLLIGSSDYALEFRAELEAIEDIVLI